MGVYVAFAQKKFRSSAAYRFDNLMKILHSLLNVFIYMEIFRMMYGSHEEYDGITLTMVATNFVLTFIIGHAFFMDDFFLYTKMNDGSIANEFLRPVNLKLRILAENIGDTLYSLLFQAIPTFVIVSLLYRFDLPHSFLSFLFFLLSLFLGYLILWSISFIVQSLAFFIINVWSISTIKNVFINILAGVYLPIWFFPDWLQAIIQYTPFESIFFLPIQNYLGTLSQEQIILSFAKQLFWLTVLSLIGEMIFEKGKKRLIVQGG